MPCRPQALKNQRSKVSKANPLAWKNEKKAITKSLKAVKVSAAALRHGPLVAPASASTDQEQLPEGAPAFSGFDLPMPASQSVAVPGFAVLSAME